MGFVGAHILIYLRYLLIILHVGFLALGCFHDSSTNNTENTDSDPKVLAIDSIIVTGEVKEGEVLKAEAVYSPGTENAIGFPEIQWYRDGEPISGATAGTYVVTSEDVGKLLTVTITPVSTDPSITVGQAFTSAAMVVSPSSGPVPDSVWVSGDRWNGGTLEAHYQTMDTSGLEPMYQWYRNGDTVQSAVGKTYLLADSDSGAVLTVDVRLRLPGQAGTQGDSLKDTVEVYGRFLPVPGIAPFHSWLGYSQAVYTVEHSGDMVIIIQSLNDDSVTALFTWVYDGVTLKKVDEHPQVAEAYSAQSINKIYMEGTFLNYNYNYQRPVDDGLVTSEMVRGVRNFQGGNSWNVFKKYDYDIVDSAMATGVPLTEDGFLSKSAKDVIYSSTWGRTVAYGSYNWSHVQNSNGTFGGGINLDIYKYEGGTWKHQHNFGEVANSLRGLVQEDNGCYAFFRETGGEEGPVTIWTNDGGGSAWRKLTEFVTADVLNSFSVYEGKIFVVHSNSTGRFQFKKYENGWDDLHSDELQIAPWGLQNTGLGNVYVTSGNNEKIYIRTAEYYEATGTYYLVKTHTFTGWENIGQRFYGGGLTTLLEYNGELYGIYTIDSDPNNWDDTGDYSLYKYYPYTKPPKVK